ncbi:hypothetical protein EPI10_001800 [Gossypium australe]|uniref:Gag-Pol polyprotein n=1 Tax=Gossypium australe TaxID=47621 RepID=A0A5B6VC57_9ROSI|nr:hypothetical protein EPI10_001800 [Gossypium australe]
MIVLSHLWDQGSQRSNPRSLAPSILSAGSVGNPKARCKHCNKFHFGKCRMISEACYRCITSTQEVDHPVTLAMPVVRGATKYSTVKSEARAPARTYAIHAREDASALDVITDTDITAVIDPSSTHSYICTNLVSVKNLPIEFTEFAVKVSNPLGQYVMVDKVCKNCPLMVWGYCFSTDLMLLPFDEFNLTQHDTVVYCKHKYIVLKCQNGELLRIEFDKLDGLSNVILAISAHKYVKKGYDAYLGYVLGSKVSESKIKSVPVVCKFPDVVPKELLSLPHVREV